MDWVIVLAAGRGVRAGGPKALHRVRGEAWWKVQQERLGRVGLPAIWVVSEHVREEMVEEGGPPTGMVVADEMGPMFASVVAGSRGIESVLGGRLNTPPTAIRGVFVLPVDVPAPGVGVFAALTAAMVDRGDVAAAVPVCGGERGHPVCLSWAFVRSRVLGREHGADARLDHLIGESRIEVEIGDPGVLVNLNTEEEFARWAEG